MKKYGLSAREKIKHQKDLAKVFQSGKSILSSDKKIKANYFVENVIQQPGVKFAVTVPKKLGNAIWRNRTKRLFRESFRLCKIGLNSVCEAKKRKLQLILSPYKLSQRENKIPRLGDVEHSIIEIIDKIIQKI